MVNSRAKGARSEREASKLVTEVLGVTARRGQQFSGIGESPDIVTGLEAVHFEVKNVQALNLKNAFEQATRDAKNGNMPVVLHKKDRQPWMLTFKFEDIWKLYEALEKIKK